MSPKVLSHWQEWIWQTSRDNQQLILNISMKKFNLFSHWLSQKPLCFGWAYIQHQPGSECIGANGQFQSSQVGIVSKWVMCWWWTTPKFTNQQQILGVFMAFPSMLETPYSNKSLQFYSIFCILNEILYLRNVNMKNQGNFQVIFYSLS